MLIFELMMIPAFVFFFFKHLKKFESVQREIIAHKARGGVAQRYGEQLRHERAAHFFHMVVFLLAMWALV